MSSRLRAAQRSTNGIAARASSDATANTPKPGCGTGSRQEQPAGVEQHQAEQHAAFARLRQRVDDDGVDQQELQQQRDVADDLDVDGGQRVDQPVVRQPRDAHREADDRRQDDADHGDQDRVQEADQEGAAEGAGRAVVDQRLADVEAGRPRRKPKPLATPSRARFAMVLLTRIQPPTDEQQDQYLVEQGPDPRIVIEGDAWQRRRSKGGAHRRFGLCRSGWPFVSIKRTGGGDGRPRPRPITGTADCTSGRRWSKERSGRARS